MIQGANSVLVAFEIPIFLRAFRGTRIMNVCFSFLYTVIYLLLVLEWFLMIYVYDATNYDLSDLLFNMLLGYNMLLHSSVIPINLVIMIKEVSMEFFQFMREDAGT